METAFESKSQLVYQHLRNYGHITSWEAIQLYGATRLAAIIFNLRKFCKIDTITIETTDSKGRIARYADYRYRGLK